DIPRADDCRTRAKASGLAGVRIAWRTRVSRVRQHGRRIYQHPWRLEELVDVVRYAGIRVSRSRTILAGIADDWAVLLGNHLVSGIARPAGGRPQGQHAVVVLFRRAFHSRVLRGGVASAAHVSFYYHGILALLGCAFMGRRFSRTLHDDHGRLHLRAVRSGA